MKKATNGTALFLAVVISALLPLWRTLNFVSSPSNTLYYGAFGVLAVMALLTGGMKAAARRTTLAAIRSDEADLLVCGVNHA